MDQSDGLVNARNPNAQAMRANPLTIGPVKKIVKIYQEVFTVTQCRDRSTVEVWKWNLRYLQNKIAHCEIVDIEGFWTGIFYQISLPFVRFLLEM